MSWCTEPSYCVYDGEGAELGCTVGGPGEGDGDLTVTGNCDFIPLTMSLPAPPPEFIPPGVPTDIDVEVFAGHDTIVDGSALLHYRYDGGGWQTSPLVQVAGELWRGTLPAPSCDDTPEFYFSVEGSVTGVVYDPPTGPSNPYIAFVGVYEAILVDNFETDQGWTVENDPSLTGGAWERAVPSTDGSWDEPTEDSDGSGHCYVTENAHHADVDWGPTMLISPTFDLSGKTDPVIRFAYWWANDDQDGDPMDIEISNDDGATWVPVLTIADVPAQWFQQEIYIATAIDPEPLTSQMKIRISVMDNPNNSQDEGGVDAVELFDVECE